MGEFEVKKLKMTSKEYKRRWLRNQPTIFRVFYYLGITLVSVGDSKAKHASYHDSYVMRVVELNKFNPLTYLVFIYFFFEGGINRVRRQAAESFIVKRY